jgi:hypothetical protein
MTIRLPVTKWIIALKDASLHTGIEHRYAIAGERLAMQFESEANFQAFVKLGLIAEAPDAQAAEVLTKQIQSQKKDVAMPPILDIPIAPKLAPLPVVTVASDKVQVETATVTPPPVTVPVTETAVTEAHPIVSCERCSTAMSFVETIRKGKGAVKVPFDVYVCPRCSMRTEVRKTK